MITTKDKGGVDLWDGNIRQKRHRQSEISHQTNDKASRKGHQYRNGAL